MSDAYTLVANLASRNRTTDRRHPQPDGFSRRTIKGHHIWLQRRTRAFGAHRLVASHHAFLAR